MLSQPVTAAVVQARPVFLDLDASLEKALDRITEAARLGAQVITMGETWLPGYPAWLDACPGAGLWDHAPVKSFARLRRNSITVPGPEVETLARLTGQLGVTLVIGVNERVSNGPGHGTLYNTLLTFGPEGVLRNHHRKLVPTYTERLVWGPGDGAGLQAVQTPTGRVGGLICWEHWMPLARQAMHESAEQIHVAVWPGAHERHQLASRHYAFEGRCFVLAAGLIMAREDIPDGLSLPDDFHYPLLLNGGSAIIGPDGRYVVEPVYDEETIVLAELDLAAIDREVMTLDVTGHYSRPDVFEFGVNRGRG